MCCSDDKKSEGRLERELNNSPVNTRTNSLIVCSFNVVNVLQCYTGSK